VPGVEGWFGFSRKEAFREKESDDKSSHSKETVISTYLYHALVLIADVAALRLIRRNRTLRTWFAAMMAAAAGAVFLAVMLGGDFFGIVRLSAYGLFVHGTIGLAGSALLLRRAAKKTALVCGVAALALAGIGIDAFFIEPTRLEVTRIEIASPKLDRPVRIVVLADLQTDRFGEYEREVFRRVLREKPDLILLAGDYLHADAARRETLRGQINAFLREIEFAAPMGVYAVRGNVDGDPQWAAMFDDLPITPVRASESFDVDPLRLTCLQLDHSRRPAEHLWAADSERFRVVLGHRPDFALVPIEADLMIAGHTHGGQVRLPGLGPVITFSEVPRRWAAGLTDLGDGRKLLVSRGVGMERGRAPRMRFLCRPELVVVVLMPDSTPE